MRYLRSSAWANSSAREDIWVKIVLARFFTRMSSLRERPFMSKGSRVATKSAEGTTLRMGAAERPGFAGGCAERPALRLDTSGERSRI